MASDDLIAAVAQEIAKGKQEDEIRQTFLKKGYSVEDITGALAVVRLQNSPTQIGIPTTSQTSVAQKPRHTAGMMLNGLMLIVVLLALSTLVSPIVRNTLGQELGITGAKKPAVTNTASSSSGTGGGLAVNYRELTTRPPASAESVTPKTTATSQKNVSGTTSAASATPPPTTSAQAVPTQTQQPQTQQQSHPTSQPTTSTSDSSNSSSNPAPQTPPSNQPPPATPAAAGVAALGLQSVADLSSPGAVGPRITPTCTPTTCADQLSALGATAKDGLVQFTGTGKHVTVSGWDFSGYQLDFEKGADVSFVDSIIKCDCGGPQIYNIVLGGDGSAVNVSFSYSDFDLTNSRKDWGGIVIHPSATHIWDHDRFHGSANDPFLAVNGNGTWTYDWFDGGPGQNTQSSSHLELIHMFSGTFLIQHVLASNVQKTEGGTTGMFYFSASTLDGGPPNISATLDSSVIEGAAVLGSIFTIQASTAEGPVNLTLTNNALQPGIDGYPKGYYGPSGTPTLTSSGNVDYDTGKAILTTTPAAVGESGALGYLQEFLQSLIKFFQKVAI